MNDPRDKMVFMAGITVEDRLQKSSNRFELVMLAAKRARQLLKGAEPLIESDNRDVVIAPSGDRRRQDTGGYSQDLTRQSNLSVPK